MPCMVGRSTTASPLILVIRAFIVLVSEGGKHLPDGRETVPCIGQLLNDTWRPRDIFAHTSEVHMIISCET